MIEAGRHVELKRNGVPGFSGLNPVFLNDEGCFVGTSVEVVDAITRNAGRVKLPSGYILSVTERDIL